MANVPCRTRSASSRAHRRLRTTVGATAAAAVLALASCGFDVQTNRPYDPAQGVNADVGAPPVLVRNLMILSRENGLGYLSATVSATERDALVSVSGKPVKPDSSLGTAFTVAIPNPVGMAAGQVIVLTNRPLITLTSPDLQVGTEAELTVEFSQAGSLTERVPVVDGNEQPYRGISPSPSPSS